MCRVSSADEIRLAIDAGDMEAVWVVSNEWAPAVLRARATLSAVGLPRPNEEGGTFALNRNLRVDGTVAWMLYFRPTGKSKRNRQVGKFLTTYLPDEPRRPQQTKPIRTNGRDLFFDDGIKRRVRVDAGGLPLPVMVVNVDGNEAELWPNNPACYYVMD